MNVYINRPLLYKEQEPEQIFEITKNYLYSKECNLIFNHSFPQLDVEKTIFVFHRQGRNSNEDIKNLYIENSYRESIDKILSISDMILILPGGGARKSEIYTIIIDNKKTPLYVLNINHEFDGVLNYLKKQNIDEQKYRVVSSLEEFIEVLDYQFKHRKVKKLD